MPATETTNFGTIFFAPESVFEFPLGLPGFEDRRKFVPVQNPRTAPILFLQSLEEPSLCFTTLPILVVDPRYRLRMMEQDLEILRFPADYQPRIGSDVLCLAVLSIRGDRHHRQSAGAGGGQPAELPGRAGRVAQEPGYSHQHLLFRREEEPYAHDVAAGGRDHPDRRRDRDRHRAHRAFAREGGNSRAAANCRWWRRKSNW